MADPFNPMRWGLPPGVGPQAARMPREAPQAQPQAPGMLPTFARPPGMMQSPSPQADRLSQAFQPPVQPTFMDPQRSMAPPGIGDFGGSQGSQSPLLKPKGPISTPTPQGPIGEGGTQDAQSGSSMGNGPSGGADTSNGNPWINPTQLAAMDGSGGKKPGDGLLSFMNSGAPAAFQNPQQGALPDGRTIDGAAETVDNPDPSKSLFGGGIGEKGSVASMLTGGSEMDPKSALSGMLKLFGGFGGFGL